ncbi:MAG: hypothetical protein F6J92_06770 [Symploca sp. SIO1A3]|nr:hypothetical protein [Symploca sp. SIO1A3]
MNYSCLPSSTLALFACFFSLAIAVSFFDYVDNKLVANKFAIATAL